jgi:dolichol-phosphate mannosyltransferase
MPAAESPARPAVSVVAPCFNEEEVLPEFLRRVGLVCAALGTSYEIVLVDDGSRDATWRIIAAAAAQDPCILGLRLRRNHGHQLALSAGIAAATGDVQLLIDADLQDPPELLPEMLALLRAERADVVYGQRRKRAGETVFKRASAAFFYRFLRAMSDVDIPADTGDFRLITRETAVLLARMPEQDRFLRGMVAWLGGRQVPLLYDRDERHAGVTKYPLKRMLKLANDAMTSFSRRPLQIATTAGIVTAVISLAIGGVSILLWALGVTIPGWTSLMAVLGLFNAMQFMMLGIMGEYIGRLFAQSRARPLFMVAESTRSGRLAARTGQTGGAGAGAAGDLATLGHRLP